MVRLGPPWFYTRAWHSNGAARSARRGPASGSKRAAASVRAREADQAAAARTQAERRIPNVFGIVFLHENGYKTDVTWG